MGAKRRAVSVEEHLRIIAERDQALETVRRLGEALGHGRFLGFHTVRTGCLIADLYPSRADALHALRATHALGDVYCPRVSARPFADIEMALAAMRPH
jgi:hypothetical protein